jgi:hypothetical protein
MQYYIDHDFYQFTTKIDSKIDTIDIKQLIKRY